MRRRPAAELVEIAKVLRAQVDFLEDLSRSIAWIEQEAHHIGMMFRPRPEPQENEEPATPESSFPARASGPGERRAVA